MVALFLRPDADISDGGWTDEGGATTLFDAVDESSFSDTDYIRSTVAAGDKVSLRLSDPSATVDEPFTVRYRCKREGTDAANLTVRLYEATSPPTLIMEFDHGSVTDAFATYTHNLTATEFAAIGDFNNLYLEFEANPTSTHNGAIIDLNFVTGDYFEDSNPGAVVTDFLSCSRASIGYAKTATGTLTQFASNELRITNLGLLVEDSRTNYLWYSQDFSNWNNNSITVTTDQVAAPDGTNTADKLLLSSTSTPYTRAHHALDASNDTIYTFSIYAKAGTGSAWCMMEMSVNEINYSYQWFELTGSGVIGTHTNGGTVTWVSSSIEAMGNGWYRCIVSAQSSTGGNLYYDYFRPCVSNGSTAGSATNDFQYVWGAQFELGSFPSSYIPTTTTSATRAADVVTCIGTLDTLIEADTDQSWLLDLKSISVPEGNTPLLAGPDASFHYIFLVINDTSLRASKAGGFQDANIGNSLTFSGGAKIGYSQTAATSASLVGGGGSVTNGNAFGVLETPATLGRGGGVSPKAFAYFRRLTAWNSRLSDTALQTLTAP